MSNYNQFTKPENALKRANEYEAIGNKAGALNLLHEVLSQRKVRTWAKSYETIMIRYIDLCVELKDHHRTKDGLHQYRNLSQAQAPGSLEVAITHLMDSAEAKLTAAASSAAAAVEEAERVTDLEQGASPEALMMSTMTEEGDRQRNERKLLVPWLVFVWETYRSVLDILRSSSKLEVVYHATANRAFEFCDKFKRKVEFRRLCEMLRSHLGSLAKAGLGPVPVNDKRLRGWDGWTDDSIELHLQTRFKQLEVTTKLELWTEGFRTVEDIHAIMHINPKKPPKSRVMANYYEKLIKIFWVSENHLFHAYAWFKYFTLSEAYNTKMTAEERTSMASNVLLAALAIPGEASSGAEGVEGLSGKDAAMAIDEVAVSAALLKNQHMAALLGFHSNPSRAALMADLHHRKILDVAKPEVARLYHTLEVDFSPLELVQVAVPDLRLVGGDPALAHLVAPLTKLCVLRLLRQLSSVYHTVNVAHFLGLCKDLDLTPDEIEKMIVVAVRAKALPGVRLDHKTACLRFGEVVLESDRMKNQLATLAHQLKKVVSIVDPAAARAGSGAASTNGPGGESRVAFFEAVRGGTEREHVATLNRKNIIERRKEDAERREKEAERLAEIAAAEAERVRKAQEALRVAEEAKERERKKRVQIAEDLRLIETKKMLDKVGASADLKGDLRSLTEKDTDALMAKAAEAQDKKLEEALKAKGEQLKRLDYVTRAVRDTEVPLLEEKRKRDLIEERARFEALSAERKVRAKAEFAKDTVLKKSVDRMLSHTKAFESAMLKERKVAYESMVHARRQEAFNRKVARARRLKAEREEEAEELEYERQRAEEDARYYLSISARLY